VEEGKRDDEGRQGVGEGEWTVACW
jgi:hypothetical protein